MAGAGVREAHAGVSPPANDAAAADRRYTGVRRLYGAAGFARLRAAHVCVVGVGGVGSWAAEALARSGVGRLTLIDLDHVAESNINRQVQALASTLGQAKVVALRDRLRDMDPAIAVDTVEDFLTPENVVALIDARYGAVLDAIDDVRAKAALAAHCRRIDRPLVVCGGAGGRSDPTRVQVADLARSTQDPLLAGLRARLRKDYGFPRDAKRKFGIDCVFSDEPLRRPLDGDTCEPGAPLACAGYGSSMAVTAAVGLAAAACIIERIATIESGN